MLASIEQCLVLAGAPSPHLSLLNLIQLRCCDRRAVSRLFLDLRTTSEGWEGAARVNALSAAPGIRAMLLCMHNNTPIQKTDRAADDHHLYVED